MNDTIIITARFRVPLRHLFDFRDLVEADAEDMSTTQDGSEAIFEVQMLRQTARELETPIYAERLI